ncbi:MAG TPA: tetratricopeptide repeat protein [Polyangiaceae bacterium]
MPLRLLLPACALVLSLGARPARASDADPGNLGPATTLFQRGKALVDAGKYAEACPVLENAQQLVLGIGVTLYLADCYEHTGRLVPAWQQFEKARQLAESNHDARAGVALDRAARLWPKLPKITYVVLPSVDVAGLTLTEDGATVDHAVFNQERPVVPGTHRIRAEARGRKPWEKTVDVTASAATARVEVPLLAEDLPAVSPTAAAPSSLSTPTAPPPNGASSDPPRSSDVSWLMDHPRRMPAQRIWGLAVLGAGAAFLTVSAVLGLEAKSQMDDSNASGHCQPNDRCDAAGLAERSDAITKATWSTVAAVGGVAGVMGGALLYLTAKDAPPERSVSLAARTQGPGASLLLEGHW